MADGFKTVQNVAEFLARRGTRRTGTHNMSRRVCSWPYCSNCGLIALKNDVTRRALKAACVWED